MLPTSRLLLSFALLAMLAPAAVRAVDEPRLQGHDFVGMHSCQTSGCHGGGEGRNQYITFTKKDWHTKSAATLNSGRSKQMGTGLDIPDVTRDARCTVCHSPMESLPPERIAHGITLEKGVSCENCHGPAEGWLRFHTRLDITRDQRLAAGLREMKDLYNRANTCVACHLWTDPSLGHKEMFFELSFQMRKEPPHWKEEDDQFLDPRAWLVGQATALRELAFHQGQTPDPKIGTRIEGLRWLLRMTSNGGAGLPDQGSEVRATQGAADRLARSAMSAHWTREGTMAQLRKYVQTGDQFRDLKLSSEDHLRRAQVLVRAIDRFWQSLKAAGAASPSFDQGMVVVVNEMEKGVGFNPTTFANALQQVEIALAQMK